MSVTDDSLLAENAGTTVAGIFICSSVLGLRPPRALRSLASKEPNPTSVTFSPSATAWVMESMRAFNREAAACWVVLAFVAASSTNLVVFISRSGVGFW